MVELGEAQHNIKGSSEGGQCEELVETILEEAH